MDTPGTDYATFSKKVNDARERFDRLRDRPDPEIDPQRLNALEAAIEELTTTFEELQVADEELRAQNAELIETRNLLELERQRYRDLFEAAPDGYLVTDEFGTIAQANRQALLILQKEDASHLAGKPLSVFIPEDERRAFREVLDRLEDDRRVEGWRLTIQSGRPYRFRHYVVTAQADFDHTNGKHIVRWTMRDVTELRSTQMMVQEMDRKLWVRVAERTAVLASENEYLRRRVDELNERSESRRRPAPDARPDDGPAQ